MQITISKNKPIVDGLVKLVCPNCKTELLEFIKGSSVLDQCWKCGTWVLSEDAENTSQSLDNNHITG